MKDWKWKDVRWYIPLGISLLAVIFNTVAILITLLR